MPECFISHQWHWRTENSFVSIFAHVKKESSCLIFKTRMHTAQKCRHHVKTKLNTCLYANQSPGKIPSKVYRHKAPKTNAGISYKNHTISKTPLNQVSNQRPSSLQAHPLISSSSSVGLLAGLCHSHLQSMLRRHTRLQSPNAHSRLARSRRLSILLQRSCLRCLTSGLRDDLAD